MITPRQTRLFRTQNLREFQRTICSLVESKDASDIGRLQDCAVIVPTAAAADQLRRTLENRVLLSSDQDAAFLPPRILTRTGWYDAMHGRMAIPPARLGMLEREVLMKAAAREASTREAPAPFKLRAGLLVEMLALYDSLLRRGVSIDVFERLRQTTIVRCQEGERKHKREPTSPCRHRGVRVGYFTTGGVSGVAGSSSKREVRSTYL